MQNVASREELLNEQLNELMDDLRMFVSNIQRPDLSDHSWKESIHDVCEELALRLVQIQEVFEETLSEKRELLNDSLGELADSLRAYSREAHDSFDQTVEQLRESLTVYAQELAEKPNVKKLQDLYQSMADGYEDLLVTLKNLRLSKVEKLSRSAYLKPINYPRNIFHVCMGAGSVLVYQFLFTRTQVLWILGILMTVVVSLEISRRYSERWNTFLVEKVFGKIARPFEKHHINSASYYVTALLLICTLFDRSVAQVSVVVLAFADPAATITGKLWGRVKLYRDKSYVGTSVFLAVGLISSLIFILLALPQFSFGYALFCAMIISITGAVAEVFTSRIDDNFTIPVACSFAAYLLF